MRPLTMSTQPRHRILMLSVAASLAFGCGQDTSVNRLSAPAASDEGREQPDVKKPKELWVTSQDHSVLFIRKFEDLSSIAQIDLPANAGPHIITFHSPDFAYVGGMTDGNVYIIDANERR